MSRLGTSRNFQWSAEGARKCVYPRFQNLELAGIFCRPKIDLWVVNIYFSMSCHSVVCEGPLYLHFFPTNGLFIQSPVSRMMPKTLRSRLWSQNVSFVVKLEAPSKTSWKKVAQIKNIGATACHAWARAETFNGLQKVLQILCVSGPKTL